MTPTGFPASLPAPRRPDPLDVPALRWGVLGTGWIAERFVRALRTSTTQLVVAVGSRTQTSAERFAAAAGALTAHGSPEALVADPAVDVVYVATPHQAHHANALLAIDADKHVLVEKPLGLDAAQAEEVAAAAATEVYATGELTPSGVNGQAAMVLTHGDGARSVLHTTLLTRTPTTAVIAGTAATLTLPGPFFMPGDVVLISADGTRTVTWAEPEPIGHGCLYNSAVEVALRVTAGELESPLRPAADVVAGMRALDEVGRQLGVGYDAAR